MIVQGFQNAQLHRKTLPIFHNSFSIDPMFARCPCQMSSGTCLFSSTVVLDTNTAESERPKIPFPLVLWRFSRPHTLIGSALAIPALHCLAAPTISSAFSFSNAISAVFAIFPSLLMNVYITGLNQITDVDIDRVNKPNLPIAAGDLSPRMANIIVISSLVASLSIGFAHPLYGTQGLNTALWGSMLLGTMYSLPPFRLKRFPFLAAFCIVAVRGAIINAGFYAHAKATAVAVADGVVKHNEVTVIGCLTSDAKCLLSSIFFAFFGIVIALMKDVPDSVGDSLFGIRTFSVRLGREHVFIMMRRLLATLFSGVGIAFSRNFMVAVSKTEKVCRAIVAISSFAAAISVRKEALCVDVEDSGMVYNYYMHLWKLFYLSYLVLPFVR